LGVRVFVRRVMAAAVGVAVGFVIVRFVAVASVVMAFVVMCGVIMPFVAMRCMVVPFVIMGFVVVPFMLVPVGAPARVAARRPILITRPQALRSRKPRHEALIHRPTLPNVTQSLNSL
jgi:hypothetical protein